MINMALKSTTTTRSEAHSVTNSWLMITLTPHIAKHVQSIQKHYMRNATMILRSVVTLLEQYWRHSVIFLYNWIHCRLKISAHILRHKSSASPGGPERKRGDYVPNQCSRELTRDRLLSPETGCGYVLNSIIDYYPQRGAVAAYSIHS